MDTAAALVLEGLAIGSTSPIWVAIGVLAGFFLRKRRKKVPTFDEETIDEAQGLTTTPSEDEA